MSLVLVKIGSSDILNLNQHLFETVDGIDNHIYSLIKKIVNIYIDLRQYHICNLSNQLMKNLGKRQSLTKCIINYGL